jgi:peptide/nickel transport system permease protein
VLTDLLAFFPATLELATIGLIIGVVLGIPMGVASAYWHEKWPDHLFRIIGLIGYSVPIFWLGLVGLFVFYYKLGWVAGPGQVDVFFTGIVTRVTGSILIDASTQGQWDVFWNAVSHITLPAVLIGYYSLAYISRMTRSVMLDQLSREYVLTARLKGASEFTVVMRHALGNAAIPLVTVIALSYGGLLEGSVLVETIFSWPGIGNYIYSSLFAADMNAVLGGTLLVGVVFVLLNMVSDVLYGTLDPRSRRRAG